MIPLILDPHPSNHLHSNVKPHSLNRNSSKASSFLLRRIRSLSHLRCADHEQEDTDDGLTPVQQYYRTHYRTDPSKVRLHRLSVLERRRSTDDPIWAKHAHTIELARARDKDSKARDEASQRGPNRNPKLRRVISAPFDVTCTASASYTAEKQSLAREKEALLRSINSLRNGISVPALREDLDLSDELQRHAELLRDLIWQRPTPLKSGEYPNTTITPSDRWGQYTIRLVSPPGLGGLACGELWYSGKFRRHASQQATVLSAMTGDQENVHPELCPCRQKLVYDILTYPTWTSIGIGRTRDSRWIVELV
ncbi:hypothetical protein KC365_g14276 [Hortaea werneckii]|nr:hypothetical protein KC342_g13161 [Hortaea werneckii]KAI7072629.1 hypothetical protein KC339_g14287 [Hortaea werneckii]KAI7213433.1 hypothetical protein KC365_g14276 [Hortaea werneckii]KAI7378950.1 hypothetical protein KC328_g13615 [Hortaea werneckii]